MKEDCARQRFIEEDCEPCEEQTAAPRREVENELIEQAKLIETLSVLIPELDSRLKTILYVEQEKSECVSNVPPSTELGKELNANNKILSSISERIKSIIARIEL